MDNNLATENSYSTTYSNSSFLPLLLLSLATQKHTPKLAQTYDLEYDYIVVGSGAAGSVVASRLTEKSCVSVLLLEAGKPPPLLTDLPAVTFQYIGTDIDWGYNTTPQAHTASIMPNRQVYLPSGKTVGGSTVLNAMNYVRGNREDYDGWAKQGAKGWSYKEVLPFFKIMEDNKNIDDLDAGYHGVGGPQTVERQNFDSKLRTAFRDASKELGIKFVDPNGRQQIGMYDIQGTMRRQQRCSSAKAYLVPAENRPKLHILANAMATKIHTNLKNGKVTATKVQFEYNGKSHLVKARREIILSAGTMGTTKLLMLSGIGPKDVLEKYEIPVVANLPVGLNFQDHCSNVVPFEFEDTPYLQKLLESSNVQEYISTRSGILTSIMGSEYVNFKSVKDSSPAPDYLHVYLESSVQAADGFFRTPEIYNQVYAPYNNRSIIICFATLLTPKSRGTIRISSNNPQDPLLIDPNYLQDEDDVSKLVEAMKYCNVLGNSSALKKVGTKPFSTLFPGCEDLARDEEKYLRCQLKSSIVSMLHYVGTAKMGDTNDPTTVVDPELKVKGVNNLRVIDASVMPTIPRANTMIPTMMIAEKAASMIRETIQCPKISL